MKKLKYAVLGLVLMITGQVYAETTIPWTKEGCESVKGTWITAHSPTDEGCDSAHCNGKSFCRGPVGMNYWSAIIWCQSIGGKIASFADICPGIPTANNSTAGSCFNVKGTGSGFVWTNIAWDSQRTLFVDLSAGAVGQGNLQALGYNATRTTKTCYALCEK